MTPTEELEPSMSELFDLEPVEFGDMAPMEDIKRTMSPRISTTTTSRTSPMLETPFSTRAQSEELDTPPYENWPGFACNPIGPRATATKTVRDYLGQLHNVLKQSNAWNYEPQENPLSPKSGRPVETLNSSGRDRLLVVIQSLIHKSTQIYRQGSTSTPFGPRDVSSLENDSFVPVPSAERLGHFLRTYMSRFEPYYGFVTENCLSPERMLDNSSGQSSSLMLLLMLAHGAMVGSPEDWSFGSTLTEACRISFRELSGSDHHTFNDLEVLRSALAMTCLTAWSGDAWHMNTAKRQWAIYTSWMKDCLLSHQHQSSQQPSESCNMDMAYNVWHEDAKRRLVYSWVGLDLEMSVFFDTPPKLSVKDLNTAFHADERPHSSGSTSIEEILSTCGQVAGDLGANSLPAFNNLFQRFLERELNEGNSTATPQQLQLLLHGLQSLASHLYECLVSFFDFGPRFYSDHLTTSFGTRALLQELQSLLKNWWTLYEHSRDKHHDPEFLTQRSLIIYHLMSARVLLSFDRLESLARSEPNKNFFRKLPHVQGRLIEEAHQVNFHCGQILKLVRTLPSEKRPVWWAAGKPYPPLWDDMSSSYSHVMQRCIGPQSLCGPPAGRSMTSPDLFRLILMQGKTPSLWIAWSLAKTA
jgi:hypothetical protein